MHLLTVAADLENLDQISQFVATVAKTANLSSKDTYRLRLAVDEIVTNIILHGYAENGLQGDIELKSHCNDYALSIIVEDHAVPYDPRLAPEPDVTVPLEQRKIGGLGVYLTIRSVDEFRYEFVNNRNRNIFVIYR
jgi:serine/threonine-protein kinase RsbW